MHSTIAQVTEHKWVKMHIITSHSLPFCSNLISSPWTTGCCQGLSICTLQYIDFYVLLNVDVWKPQYASACLFTQEKMLLWHIYDAVARCMKGWNIAIIDQNKTHFFCFFTMTRDSLFTFFNAFVHTNGFL